MTQRRPSRGEIVLTGLGRGFSSGRTGMGGGAALIRLMPSQLQAMFGTAPRARRRTAATGPFAVDGVVA